MTTAGNYKYLGRLDATFDAEGVLTGIVAEASYPRRVVPLEQEQAGLIDELGIACVRISEARREAGLSSFIQKYPARDHRPHGLGIGGR